MKTYLRQQRAMETQVVAPFTGEGAYHGSTKPRAGPPARVEIPEVVEEMRAYTLDAYASGQASEIEDFDAVFPNLHETVGAIEAPSQADIRDDGVTFCWCPLEQAMVEAGPLTKRVLVEMARHIEGRKRHVYIDSKIQYFEPGDLPVDSQHWHVDGSITARGPHVEQLGHGVVHDMLARLRGPAAPPTYLSYQSSLHCATLFASEPVALRLPALMPNFDELDRMVRALGPRCTPQTSTSIVRFDGLSLHRAVPANDAGWRLWVRCVETDRRVELNTSIIECYGTVFRPTDAARA